MRRLPRPERAVSGSASPGPSPKTPCNRGILGGVAAHRLFEPRRRGLNGGGHSLKRTGLAVRLNAGGLSLKRTRLWARFPVLQGKCREFLRIRTLRSQRSPEFLRHFEEFGTNSLRTRTGNLSRRARNPVDGAGNRNSLLVAAHPPGQQNENELHRQRRHRGTLARPRPARIGRNPWSR